MTLWQANEPDAARRCVGMYIVEDDGVTPAPHSTNFAGHVMIRQGSTIVVAAEGTLENIGGYDGAFLYTATQAETDFDGIEFEVFIDWAGEYNYSSSIAHVSQDGWIRNETDANRRCVSMIIVEDDGVTLAPIGTNFSGHVMVRQGGDTVAAASGTLENIGGYAGKFLYTATQAETDYDGCEFRSSSTGADPSTRPRPTSRLRRALAVESRRSSRSCRPSRIRRRVPPTDSRPTTRPPARRRSC